VSYAQIWKDCYAKYAESHKLLSNWSAEDFDGLLIDDVLYTLKENQAVLAEGATDLKAIQNNDKLVCCPLSYVFLNLPSGVTKLWPSLQ
jgi:hypothetical protein